MEKFDYIVAVIGAGVSGSEAARQLAGRGIATVLFEQNSLPYGKIEEGLPKWHIKLRNQEERKIDEKIKHDLISFVPNTAMGTDFNLRDLLNWGFSAIILAIGAGRDRQLLLPGIDAYRGKGFCYQSELVFWFNHNHEPGFQGPDCRPEDGGIVIGGGLASLDVAKILMLETVSHALKIKGVPVDLFTLEREGFPIIFKKYGVSLTSLGLKGCQLVYRRKVVDMPLTPMPEDADEQRRERVFQLRQRILDNFRQKYLFRVKEGLVPFKHLYDGHELKGMVFRVRELRGKDWHDTPHLKKIYSPFIVSSIGSVPGRFGDLPADGDLLAIEDQSTGRLRGFDNVFAMGNAVTGRGNIKESVSHSRETIVRILDTRDWERQYGYEDRIIQEEIQSAEAIQKITYELGEKKPPANAEISHILSRVAQLQGKAGYDGHYDKWIKSHLPIRLEDLSDQEN